MRIQISSREKQLLRMASIGMADKQIAVQLAISTATVRTYWDRVRLKLNAQNRTHVVCLAIGLGLIAAPKFMPEPASDAPSVIQEDGAVTKR